MRIRSITGRGRRLRQFRSAAHAAFGVGRPRSRVRAHRRRRALESGSLGTVDDSTAGRLQDCRWCRWRRSNNRGAVWNWHCGLRLRSVRLCWLGGLRTGWIHVSLRIANEDFQQFLYDRLAGSVDGRRRVGLLYPLPDATTDRAGDVEADAARVAVRFRDTAGQSADGRLVKSGLEQPAKLEFVFSQARSGRHQSRAVEDSAPSRNRGGGRAGPSFRASRLAFSHRTAFWRHLRDRA